MHVPCVYVVTTFCYGSTSNLHIYYARREHAGMQSSRTCFVPTSTTKHTGRSNTAPASADSRRDRCDRLTLALVSVTVPPQIVVATGEATKEVCLHWSATSTTNYYYYYYYYYYCYSHTLDCQLVTDLGRRHLWSADVHTLCSPSDTDTARW